MTNTLKAIFLACLVAGTLDITYAIIMWGPVFGKISALQLLQGIAGVLIGKSALTGSFATALLGLAIHYGISLAWAGIYFFIFPYLPLLARNKWISGILYGLVVWIMMQLLIVPLVKRQAYVFHWEAFIKNIAPMLLLFGPAIAIIIDRTYSKMFVSDRQTG